ncbi:MAG TPA: hypothetical protein VGA56_19720, partial [Opitutaceae bacterium]
KPGTRERVIPSVQGVAFTDDTAALNGGFSNVSWSPDQKRMVFHRALEATWPPVVETFSRDEQFRAVRAGVFPSYSPDGRALMSNTAYAATFHNAVVLMNPDGTNRRVAFDDPEESAVAPVWSPTGDRIAFGLGGYFRAVRAGAQAHLAIVNADGSGLRRVTSGNGNHGFPSWSPDGRRLVFSSADAQSKGLSILDLVSGKTTTLTSRPSTDNFPYWSPTRDSILFTSNRDGDWDLYTMRTDGTDLKRLTTTPGNDAHSAWSFDGEWIAFSSARGGFKDEMPRAEGGV